MTKVISDYNKNVKLYIDLISCSSWNHYWMWTCTWSAFTSHVVCMGETSNSSYKYSGPFLRPKIMWHVWTSQWV